MINCEKKYFVKRIGERTGSGKLPLLGQHGANSKEDRCLIVHRCTSAAAVRIKNTRENPPVPVSRHRTGNPRVLRAFYIRRSEHVVKLLERQRQRDLGDLLVLQF